MHIKKIKSPNQPFSPFSLVLTFDAPYNVSVFTHLLNGTKAVNTGDTDRLKQQLLDLLSSNE
jgi:hypothetical protein